MSEVMGTGSLEEEVRRQQREAEERAAAEAKKAEEEAAAAAAESEKVAQEAVANAQAQAEQAAGASQEAASAIANTELNPADPEMPDRGIRSGGLPRITEADKTDAQFMRDVRESVLDTRFKVNKYDTEDGYDSSLNRPHLASKLVGHAADLPSEAESGNSVSVDFGSIRNKEQGFHLLMTASDDAAKVKIAKPIASQLGVSVESFLAQAENFMYDNYGRQVFSSPYSNAAKIRTFNNGLKNVGLTDVSGAVLDVNTATVPDFLRAARMDPSGATADAVYKYAKKLSEVPGSIWYGYDVQKDMFAFMDSADLTKKQYDDEIDRINQSFSYSEGYDEDNLTAYLSAYRDLTTAYGDNERVLGYMLRDLNKSWSDHTGLKAMTREQADGALKSLDQRLAEAELTAKSEEEAKKGTFGIIKDFFAAGVDWAKSLGKQEKQEEQGELTTVDEIIKQLDQPTTSSSSSSSSGGSSIMGGGTVSAGGQDMAVSKPIASADGMPSSEEMFPEGGTQAEAGFDNPLGLSEETLAASRKEQSGPVYQPNANVESLPYDPEMSDAEAWAAYRNGYQLAPQNLNQISRFTMNPDISGIALGELNTDTAIDSTKKHGWYIGQAANTIRSSHADQTTKAAAELALMDFALGIYQDATAPNASNERPTGRNMYDYAIEMDKAYMDRLSEITDIVNDMDTGAGEAAVDAVNEREARMEGYTQQMLNNNGTIEAANALAEYHEFDWVDLNMDDTCNKVRKDASVSGKMFGENGTYWQGNSPAAKEYNTILATMGKRDAMNFRREMSLSTIDLAEDYARAAHNIGMTTEEFLASAGITSSDQLADMAYTCMKANGNAIADDPQAQADINAVAVPGASVGETVLGNRVSGKEQLGLAGSYSWTDYQEGFASAAYNGLSLIDYQTTVQRNKDHYVGKYGNMMAPQMYRRDLNELLASGTLSTELENDLRNNMSRAYDIFDIGYEIDPDGLKGVVRKELVEFQDRIERLDSIIGTLTPEQQRNVRTASMIFSQGLSMATTAATFGVSTKMLGMSPKVALKLGDALGSGVRTWDDSFDQNKHAGMSTGMAALIAMIDTAGQTSIEHMNTGSFMELLFGDVDLTSAMRMTRNNPKGFAAALGRQLVGNPISEGFEEVGQSVLQKGLDIFDSIIVAAENGERISESMVYDHIRNNIGAIDGKEFFEELKQEFGAGAAMGAFFSVLGTARTGLSSVGDIKAFNKYESVKMATQIAEGDVQATPENLGKLYDLLDKDRTDPKFRKYMDKGSIQAQKDRQVITAMLEGTEFNMLNSSSDHAQKAIEYGEKKAAAKASIDTAKGRWVELSKRVANGDLSAVPALTTAQQQLAKAQTAYTEADSAQKKHNMAASHDASEWLKACKERAAVLTSDGINYRMERMRLVRDGLAAREYYEHVKAYEERKARDAAADIEVMGLTEDEIDAEIDQMLELDNRVDTAEAEREAMGYDDETIAALKGETEEQQNKNADRRAAIIRNQRNQYKSLSDRMQTAQELEDEDAYNELMGQRSVYERRLGRLGAETADPDADKKAKDEARFERAADIATGMTKEQRDAAVVERQEQANMDAMDAEMFIEERYPNASDEQKDRIREMWANAPAEAVASEATPEVAGPVESIDSAKKRRLQNAQKFAGQVTRRYGVKTQIVPSNNEILKGAPAAYDRKTDTIYVSENATQGDIIRAKMVHELTHRTEDTSAYDELSKAILSAHFKGNKDNETAERNRIRDRYNAFYKKNGIQKNISEAEIDQELVAYAAEKLIGGDEDMVNRLVADSPSVARRIMDAIKSVLDKLTGVKGKDVDDLRKVEKMFQKALNEAAKQRKANTTVQHSIPDIFSTETGEALTGTVGGDTVVQYSLTSWTPEEQSAVRSNLINKGYDEDAVDNWIDDVNSVAAIVAADRDRLDFEAADNQVMLKPNAEYVRTLDASTLCAKRLLYQGTFNAIQHRMPNKVMTSDDLIRLRNMMAESGYETPCGICYVESRRRNLGTFAQKWLKDYDPKGGYQPKLDDVTTTDGLERMRIQHPEVYDSFVGEMKRKGSNNPKVVQLRTDYHGDIRKLSKSDIDKIIKIGGLRVQSFSDFETPHLLDMMQAVLDMTENNLTSQAYTKVPNFAWVFGDTGIKINLSLIAEGDGFDADGNLAFSSYEGMDFDEAMRLRDRYSQNVGTILVGLSDKHIRAAMADPRIDFIIPFHKSGWGKRQLSQLSGMSGYMDYTRDQNERRVIGQTKTGKPKTKNVPENFHPVDYWDYSLTGNQNAETYLRMCEEDGRIPKFSRFLSKDADGHWVAPDGYWKLLIDFKMYDNDGVGAPQMPVRPNFNMEEARRILGEYEGGANELPVAHDIVERFVSEKSGTGNVQYSVSDELDGKVRPANMPENNYMRGRTVDRNKVIEDGMNNVKAKNSKFNTGNKVFVENRQSGRPIQVTKESIRHGLSGGVLRQSRNARMGAVIGDVLEDAVKICELKPRPGMVRAYAMLGATQDSEYVYPVKLIVNETAEDMGDLTGIESYNGIGKQYLYSANTEEGTKKEPAAISPGVQGENPTTLTGSDIRIADLWESVKGHFMEGLEVLEDDENVQRSIDVSTLPDDDFLRSEIDEWKRGGASYSVDAQADTGDRQFATKTIQENAYVPDHIKQVFMNDPARREYSKDYNARQLDDAWNRVQSEGVDGVKNRLLAQDTTFTTEDNADAIVLMSQSLHDDDLDTFMSIASKYNTEGTDQAKALQIRSLMKTMTPTGFAQKVIGDASRKMDEHLKSHNRQSKKISRKVKDIDDKLGLRNLDGRSGIQKLVEAGESIKIDNKYGVPLNDRQRVLIKEFGLEKVRHPGMFYNWASTKQRMLMDILTTDDVYAEDYNGFNLVERLIRMEAGQPVVTKADIAYITENMNLFNSYADRDSRGADIALSRAYEAYGNINPATGKMKRRTWRYTSMLLSVPSAVRNVIGNAAQSVPNAIADGVAVELDRLFSAITGADRTRAHINISDRIDGWEAFRDETFNTFRDYFIDKTVTQYGEGRYNENQRGRVFENQFGETLRRMEGLLMSVGDRNFWKKKFFNSLAEQQHLAEINGTAFDLEAAMKTAEAEANYATFNEDNAVRSLFTKMKDIPAIGTVLDHIMPFTGVPTNIIKRQIEFSPIGIAATAWKHGLNAIKGGDFDQRAFVDGMARGLTGSALMGIGAILLKEGILKMGTKEEDDDKSYGVRTAQGDQYGVYFTIGDKNYSISTFSPAASALVAGAFVADALKNNEAWYQAIVNGTLKNVNEIFDASYMSSLADLLNTSNGGNIVDNAVPTVLNSMLTQNIPAPITHLASAMDPYVRDTKDKDAIMEVVKTTMSKIPGARELLPEKVDVAGRAVENTKYGAAAFIDPFSTSYVVDDPALNEMIRLRDVLTEKGASEPRAHMASDALSGRRNTLTQNKVTYTVSPEEKEAYRKRYGELWRNGGMTYDKKGKRIPVQGVEELVASRYYQLMDDEEKADAIKEIITAAKNGATYEIMNHK